MKHLQKMTVYERFWACTHYLDAYVPGGFQDTPIWTDLDPYMDPIWTPNSTKSDPNSWTLEGLADSNFGLPKPGFSKIPGFSGQPPKSAKSWLYPEKCQIWVPPLARGPPKRDPPKFPELTL